MSKVDPFRLTLVFTPSRLLFFGILDGNASEAHTFMGRIRPLVDDFIARVRAEAAQTAQSGAGGPDER